MPARRDPSYNKTLTLLCSLMSAFFWIVRPCAADTEVPSIAPEISSVYPLGGQRGVDLDIEIRGSHLEAIEKLTFRSSAIRGGIVSTQHRLVRVHLTISDQAEVGRHQFRLTGSQGTATGFFNVGSLQEIREVEPNSRLGESHPTDFPVLINGTAGPDDADYFQFHAEAGRTIVLDVDAKRSGSALDPVLTLLDTGGREVAYCDDYYNFKDAFLTHTFEKSGWYIVRVHASYRRSAEYAPYRLLINDGPHASYTLPAGARRGAVVDLKVEGTNLARTDRAWLGNDRQGDSTPDAVILKRGDTQLHLRLTIPERLAVGSYRLHLAAGPSESPVPLRFEVSDLPEITVEDELIDRRHPFEVQAPVIVNGRIGNRGSDYLKRVHHFEIHAGTDQRYEFSVFSWELGFQFDPVIGLYDLAGNKLAYEDDPAPNSFIHEPATHDPRLVYRFEKGGRYRLMVRDAAYRGGTGSVYRLRIRETEPDFNLEARTAETTIYLGDQSHVLVQLRRTGGVHRVERFKKPGNEIENYRLQEDDGWNTPIHVWAGELPPGVSGEKVLVEPRNTTFRGNDAEELFVDGTLVEVPIRVAAQAKPGVFPISIFAEGEFQDRKVKRKARVLHGGRGFRRLPTWDNRVYLTIAKAPELILETPERFKASKGGSSRLKLAVYRRHSAPVRIEGTGFPHGVHFETVEVPAGTGKAEITIHVSGEARESVTQVVLVGSLEVGDREINVSSPLIELEISGETHGMAARE